MEQEEKKLDLEKLKTVHFIGIGGIGVSALARMMMLRGIRVSGSDISLSPITEELKRLGTSVFEGHGRKNVPTNASLIIYTLAIGLDNPELVEAREKELPLMTYPEALGEISRQYFTVAVSGTHGKTTTTGMIGKVFTDAGLKPTVLIGSILKDEKSNFIGGEGKYFITEACEYRRSFLNLSPKVVVITNIDDDHLDYYEDIEDIEKAFAELAEKLPADGFLICDAHDPRLAKAIKRSPGKVIDYKEYYDENLRLRVPGKHNLLNAAAALALADVLHIKDEVAIEALEAFSGTWRRFEYNGKTKAGALLYDDYAHHPTEIKATLRALREKFPDKHLTIVFQPHLYSRTKILLKSFGEAFKDADSVLIAPIYAAREPNDPSISAQILAANIKLKTERALAFSNFEAIVNHLKKTLKQDGVLMTMGAGDVNKVGEALLRL